MPMIVIVSRMKSGARNLVKRALIALLVRGAVLRFFSKLKSNYSREQV